MQKFNLLHVFEALANPHRMRIIASLLASRKYVSELARDVELSRPLLYMHLKRLENAGLVFGKLELSDDGKAMKYYEIHDFAIEVTPQLIAKAADQLELEEAHRQSQNDDDEEEN